MVNHIGIFDGSVRLLIKFFFWVKFLSQVRAEVSRKSKDLATRLQRYQSEQHLQARPFHNSSLFKKKRDWSNFTFSYDGDRYDRGCVISIHHAIQIGFYIPAATTILITTDFKMAPSTSMPLLKWLEDTKFSEDITDTILALTILTKNAEKEFFIERVKVKDNNEVH